MTETIPKDENEATASDVFSWIVRGLLTLLLYISFTGIFLFLVVDLKTGIFEHGEGWHDLDSWEMIFLVLLFGLSARFFKKCRQQNKGYWASKWRYIYFVVLYGAVWFSLLIIISQDERYHLLLQEYLYELDLVYDIGLLLVIFSMPPIVRFWEESKPGDVSPLKDNLGTI